VDRTLVGRAQRGDRDAYEAIVRAVAPRLYRIAHRIVRDADAAEDAAQQALVTIWRELPSLRDLDRFDAWTYRLLVRACLAESRRRRRAGVVHVTMEDAIPADGDPIAGVDLRDQLARALDELSTEHRVVVVLHHYVGLPLAEIAGILGIPYGTVGSRLHHATRALRASLTEPAATPLAGGQPA
jgi:RNA polymerase sigma-70 factor (ECF subfamily)